MNTSLIDLPEAPTSAPAAREVERWSAVFVLSGDVSASERDQVLARLQRAAWVTRRQGELSLAVGVAGPMDEALAEAVAAVRSALTPVTTAEVVEVRMVGHSRAVRQIEQQKPVTYYGVTECARALGVSPQRVRQLLDQDKLPAPDAVLGGKALWESDAFDTFASIRRQLVERTKLGLDPMAPPAAPQPEDEK